MVDATKKTIVDYTPVWSTYSGAFASLFLFLVMLDVYLRSKSVLVAVLMSIQFAVVLMSVRNMMVHLDLRLRRDAERDYGKAVSE
jgi:hypothetical protein